MGKRKSEEHIRRKIRRLEKKLRKNKDVSSVRGSSSADDTPPRRLSTDPDVEDYEMTLTDDPMDEPLPEPALLPASLPAPLPAPTIEDCVQSNAETIPTELLQLLGEAKKSDPKPGMAIPNQISERWGKILIDGLAKDNKDALLESILIPENFQLSKAPKLNPEVEILLNDSVKNRDKRLEKAQNQLGLGIAGIASLSRDIIHTNMEKTELFRRLSEIGQILLDLHFEESVNRRKLLLPLMDKKFWDLTKGVKRDTYLFGESLGEQIRNSKNIEKSSVHLKKASTAPQTSQRKGPPQQGNARPPRQGLKAAPTRNQQYQGPAQSTARRTNPPPQRGRYPTANYNHKPRRA